jgi:Mn2+/Fe2+ NRAMP family transporter
MTAVQETIARVSMITGESLTATLRRHYPRWISIVLVILVVCANTLNIGADLGAMADATALLLPHLPVAVYAILYAVLILILEIFLTYKTYAHVLKWFAMSLLAYVFTALLVTTNWNEVVRAAIWPTIIVDRTFFLSLIAVLGTTISPYIFLWQSNEEVEEEISQGRTTQKARLGATDAEITAMRADVAFGMGFSNLIMFCIIVTAASAFFRHGLHDIQTSAEAARALEPLAGRFSSLLFAAGIIGTGLLAVPVLSASASYALSDIFGWSNGLYKKLREAHGFYGAITISTLIGLLLTFSGVNPIKALFWSAVVNGLVAPLFIGMILLIGNNQKLMGKRKNGPLTNALVGGAFVLMLGAAIGFFIL